MCFSCAFALDKLWFTQSQEVAIVSGAVFALDGRDAGMMGSPEDKIAIGAACSLHTMDQGLSILGHDRSCTTVQNSSLLAAARTQSGTPRFSLAERCQRLWKEKGSYLGSSEIATKPGTEAWIVLSATGQVSQQLYMHQARRDVEPVGLKASELKLLLLGSQNL